MQAGDRPAHLVPVVGGVPGRQIGAQAERELKDFYKPDIERLERLIERDLSAWKE